MILGPQGTGKTYLGVKLCEDLLRKGKYKCKTNIKSYAEKSEHNGKIEYFEKITDIVDDFDDYTIYFIDELARKYPKGCPQDTKFLGWLMQSRKCHRIVIMTHQTYLLVPQWLREPIENVYTTHHFISKNLCLTDFGKPILDEETLDWKITSDELYIYKRNTSVSSLYNTYEPVPEL